MEPKPKPKIVLAGGTGFIGQYLAQEWARSGAEIIHIARSRGAIPWTDKSAIIRALEGASLLVNLAGKSVNCRYTERNKREILQSRIETTRALGEALQLCKNPPALWINSGTATIYRHAEDRPMTEQEGELGTGFSVDVARVWEETIFNFSLPRTRQVVLRISIVLGKGGGVVTPISRLVRFGLGGRQGHGRQMFSWIHIHDLLRIIEFVQQHPELSGALNAAAPHPVQNQELMKTWRKAMGKSIGLPAPKWLLEIGARFIKTETELVLKSRWVLPQRLLDAGFEFHYPRIEDCLAEVLKSS